MKFYYKNESWEIKAPNVIELLKHIISLETKKKYITLKICASMVYTLCESVVTWGDENYKQLIGSFDESLSLYYTTINSNQKGQFKTINRNNILGLKNDFDYLFKLFSRILSSMIIDKKKKLYFEV